MRRGVISYIAVLLGIAIGLIAGLIYTWEINPQIQTDVAPWQLSEDYQRQYLIAISLAYSKDHDMMRTANRLAYLRLGDKTWPKLADEACSLARTSYASTNTGLTAIRSMVELLQTQHVSSCASALLPLATSTQAPPPTIVTVTATLIPPPTKTPTSTLGATFTPATQPFEESPTPAGDFRLVLVEPYCDPKIAGLVQVTVEDTDGAEIPAIQVEADSGDAKDFFYTGLKTEHGRGYADYQMESGNSYIISLPGMSDKSRPLEAGSCTAAASAGGGKSVTGYRLVFKRIAGH